MNDLIESCVEADDFPKNLVHHDKHKYELKTYFGVLERRKDTFFCADGNAAVDFWDLKDPMSEPPDFEYKRLKDSTEVKDHLGISDLRKASDPICRYVFLHGRDESSRDVLEVSRPMLTNIMTYHQIGPSFLDFLFSFGNQDHANPQDFHYSGIRHETRLSETHRGLHIKKLNRSGRTIQLSYSLRCVEKISETEWSIRPLATHQSFDFEYGNAVWMILKGSENLKKKIIEETQSKERHAPSHYFDMASSFSSALSTHSVLCNLAGENWRWYINDMEREVQKITRKTLTLEVLVAAQSKPPLVSRLTRAETGFLVADRDPMTMRKSKPKTASKQNVTRHLSEKNNGFKRENMPSSTAHLNPTDDPFAGDISPKDLQRIEAIEDQANEILLVLDLNTEVLSALKAYFEELVKPKTCPKELKLDGEERVGLFVHKLEATMREIHIQRTRVQTLLRLLADRKALLYGILNIRSMRASYALADEAKFSTHQMEYMTQEMHILAEKTKRETVSMRIITLVTLFFLPGTFISTLMSTDIIQFQKTSSGSTQKIVSAGAINIFLAITLPLMLLTFLAWIAVNEWSKRKERKDREKLAARNKEGEP